MRPPPSFGAELEAFFLRLVDERVERRLAELGVTVAAPEYTSNSLPADVSRRTFGSWCRSGRVEGAQREGKGWRCSRAAWAVARAVPAHRPKGCDGRFVAGNDVELDADELLRRAGLRPTRDGSEP